MGAQSVLPVTITREFLCSAVRRPFSCKVRSPPLALSRPAGIHRFVGCGISTPSSRTDSLSHFPSHPRLPPFPPLTYCLFAQYLYYYLYVYFLRSQWVSSIQAYLRHSSVLFLKNLLFCFGTSFGRVLLTCLSFLPASPPPGLLLLFSKLSILLLPSSGVSVLRFPSLLSYFLISHCLPTPTW